MKTETKKMLLENVKLTRHPEQKIGGQSCGIMSRGIKLESELGITIIVDNYRSQFKNRELAFLLMDLAIDEVMK